MKACLSGCFIVNGIPKYITGKLVVAQPVIAFMISILFYSKLIGTIELFAKLILKPDIFVKSVSRILKETTVVASALRTNAVSSAYCNAIMASGNFGESLAERE